MRAIWMLVLLAACPPKVEPQTCDDVVGDFLAETSTIRACDAPSECGQVLAGTSCGCTQDWVARLDADTTAWEALLQDVTDGECDAGLTSDCSCPEAFGFACVDHVCTWNYADISSGLPDCHAADGDTYELQSMVVAGDTLTVTVSYGGGCQTHDIVLCWPDGSFLESNPVQASLELWHDNHDDPCDAYLTEDHALDLTPLKQAWQSAYHADHGTILLHVGALNATYTF